MDTDVEIAKVAMIETNVILKTNIIRYYLQRIGIWFVPFEKRTFKLNTELIIKIMEIKDIKVKVTYEVGLGGLDATEQEFNQLKELFEDGKELDGMGHDKFNEARECFIYFVMWR